MKHELEIKNEAAMNKWNVSVGTVFCCNGAECTVESIRIDNGSYRVKCSGQPEALLLQLNELLESSAITIK